MQTTPARLLPIAGAFNIRDLGGYAHAGGETRWRRILRGDGLHRLTPQGIEDLVAAGVVMVVDLRHDNELASHPNPFRDHATITYRHLSLFEDLAPAAMTGGDVLLEGAEASLLEAPLEVLRQVGTEIEETNSGLRVRRNGAGIVAADIVTDPFPGFPTDLQAQFMALMTRARGTARITETIFENRFMHVAELARFGARISLEGQVATVEGVERLKGAPVMATDLRASVSLVIAGLAAEGETVINRVYHLDRGFERLEDKIGRCGAVIERISG